MNQLNSNQIQTQEVMTDSSVDRPRLGVKPFDFRGNGFVYFKIWIVNVLLTVITLGLYSPWAYVRRKRYFYNHTIVAGNAFDYIAQPLELLKRRLIGVVIFAVYLLVASIKPQTEPFFIAAFVLALPFLIREWKKYHTRHTAYRNVRFDFNGNLSGAYEIYLAWPILSVLTLGLVYPFAAMRRKHYGINNSGFSSTSFSTHLNIKKLYEIYAIAGLILVGVLIVVWFGGARFIMNSYTNIDQSLAGSSGPTVRWSVIFFMTIIMVVVWSFIYAFVYTELYNHLWRNTRLEQHRFRSTYTTQKLFLILLTNAALIGITLGLYWPWARVRLDRYRAQQLELLAAGNLNKLIDSSKG